MPRDFYEILGLQRGASADDIKKAYRGLSKELHPDKHKGDKAAENRFKEVNEAYETLSNPQKKQMYDQFGKAGSQGGGRPSGGFGGFDFSSFTGGGGQSFDFGDLFEGFFGGGQRGRGGGPAKGEDIETLVDVDFAMTVSGASRPISFEALRPCKECDGSGATPGSSVVTCSDCRGSGQITRTAQSFFGAMQQRVQCPRCHGSGKVPEKPCPQCRGAGRRKEKVTVPIDIPAGIADGQTLRIRAEGNAGERGAEAGDLYVHVRVSPDPRFAREGDDIHSTLIISVPDAVLGAEMQVETVQGSVTLKVPAGTQSGQMLRIKGKGMPVLQTSRHGDHFVTVTVEIPAKLSRDERKLLEEWRKLQS